MMKSLLGVFVLSASMVFGVLRADISGPNGVPDCRVDLYDLAVFAAEWLQEDENCMSLGNELAVNGGFDVDLSYWSADAGWSWISSAMAEYAGSTPGRAISQSLVITAGKTYRVEFYFNYVASIQLTGYLGGQSFIVSVGNNSLDVVAGASDTLISFITSSGIGQARIDNVSVREVLTDGGVVVMSPVDDVWPWK